MREILDERELEARRQHRRVILTEILMSVTVLVLVGFLTLVVMGYSFNLREIGGTGEVVERSGLVQVSSVPTGATIYIDGESALLLNTNASRTMLAGEHEIALKREGFDEWSKRVKVTEGMMYRLNYPRLFRLEREVEEVLTFEQAVKEYTTVPKLEAVNGVVETEGAKLMSVSPNCEKMVIWMERGLYVMNLNENKPVLEFLELVDASGERVGVDSMTEVEWSESGERMLAVINGKWMVVDVRDAKATVWLEELLGEKQVVKKVSFVTEAGDRLLVLNGKKELMEVNVRDKEVGKPLVAEVEMFDNEGGRVVYVTKAKTMEGVEEGEKKVIETETSDEAETQERREWQVRAYRLGEDETYLVAEAETMPVVGVMRYFQEFYVGVAEAGRFEVLKKASWPVAGEGVVKVLEKEVEFVAASVERRGKGMVFELMGEAGERGVFDVEAVALMKVEMSGGEEGWADEFLRYGVSENGALTVRDYDGLNERELVAEGVLAGRVVAISGSNRWLYYMMKTEGGEMLVRERVM